MQDTSVLQLVFHAGWFVKGILAILAGFSIFSWAVMAHKLIALTAASRQSALFRRALDSGAGLSELFETARALTDSPLANLFRGAYEARSRSPRMSVSALLKRHATAETDRMQSYLPFLATTGSTTPFIGLLGTVWGIMDAFRGIGAAGSASLAVVSPAIAEALITTAAGLLAAIPAVMAYNAFLNQIRKIELELDDLADDLQGRLKEPATHADRIPAPLSL